MSILLHAGWTEKRRTSQEQRKFTFDFLRPGTAGTRRLQTILQPRARRTGLVLGVARGGMITSEIEPCMQSRYKEGHRAPPTPPPKEKNKTYSWHNKRVLSVRSKTWKSQPDVFKLNTRNFNMASTNGLQTRREKEQLGTEKTYDGRGDTRKRVRKP